MPFFLFFLKKSVAHVLTPEKNDIKYTYFVVYLVLILIGFIDPIITKNTFLVLYIIIPFALEPKRMQINDGQSPETVKIKL